MKKENALWRRKHVLGRLGLHTHALRSAWSHDLGHAIAFDAWDHQWQRDAGGAYARYPLRTNGEHYNLGEALRNPRVGHTRWQRHVDMVLAGERTPHAIIPVAVDPDAKPNRGAKGWLPLVLDGHVECGDDGEVWFCADRANWL